MKTEPSGRIWEAAERFFKAAEAIRCNEKISIEELAYPLIVNYAFLCELSLKAAESKIKPSATNTESAVHGHQLKTLFHNLKPDTQNFIQTEFESTSGRELQPLLDECSRYFITGRYEFEQSGGSYNFSGIRILAKYLLSAVFVYGQGR